MTPEEAKVLYKVFAETMKSEFETTKKVIRAIPEDKKSYKPDPKAKSADELAWHIATSELWFINVVIDGKATMPEPLAIPASVSSILEWYEPQYNDLVKRLPELPAEKLSMPIPLFGDFVLPAVSYLNIMNL